MSETRKKILLIEDEAQIRKFLRISLDAHGYEVHESRLAVDAMKQCAVIKPHLVILDLGLPDLDGQQVIKRLREWTQIPIIVLSVRESEAEKVEALDAGANDYVTKPFGIGELMARIRANLRDTDKDPDESSVFQSRDLSVDFVARTATFRGEAVHLSRKEFNLLQLLVRNRGKVVTHQQLLREIWGPSQQDETHYLRVLVGQLRQKLDDEPMNPSFIATVQGIGYRFLDSSLY